MNNKISNPKVEVSNTKEMNDLDYLNDVLESTKNLVCNYSTTLNEASNNAFYEKLKEIFNETSIIQRDLFNLMFQKGWYALEKADNEKITEAFNKYSQEIEQI